MLRLSGVIAVVLSCLLATLLFLRIRTLHLTGEVWNFNEGALHVRVDTGPGTEVLLSWKAPDSLPVAISSNDAQRVVGLQFEDPILFGIPHEARIAVTHRWVELPAMRWSYGCTELQSQGRTYVCERSPAAFFWILGLMAAAPLLCWLPFALGAFLLRKPPSPPLYGDDGLVEVRR
jgi:hypothetical protein